MKVPPKSPLIIGVFFTTKSTVLKGETNTSRSNFFAKRSTVPSMVTPIEGASKIYSFIVKTPFCISPFTVIELYGNPFFVTPGNLPLKVSVILMKERIFDNKPSRLNLPSLR